MSHPLLSLVEKMFPGHQSDLTASSWRPNTDIYRTSDGWLIKVDLAGVAPEDVEITRRGNRLTVTGVRRDWSTHECCHCQQMEISYSRFERQLVLPCDMDTARIEAEHKYGMLLLRVFLRTQ